MNAKALFLATLDQATAVIDHVAPDDYHRPTPDTEWDVAALAGHMLYELCWVPDLLQGKTIAEVGSVYDGDLIGCIGGKLACSSCTCPGGTGYC